MHELLRQILDHADLYDKNYNENEDMLNLSDKTSVFFRGLSSICLSTLQGYEKICHEIHEQTRENHFLAKALSKKVLFLHAKILRILPLPCVNDYRQHSQTLQTFRLVIVGALIRLSLVGGQK